MHYHETPAPPPLDRWVRCFWFLRVDGAGPPEPVVPDGRLEIVLHRAEPFAQVQADGSMRAQAPAMLSGQLTGPILLGPRGPADIVGIRFRTAAARDLLRVPLHELTDRLLPLRAFDASLDAALTAAAHAGDPVRAMTAVLLARMRTRRHDSSPAAVLRIARGEPVAQVARALRISTRTLERRVHSDVGLPPKVLQRVLRFRAYYALVQASPGNGARAAAMAGYFDQTHANRDFRRFTGTNPTDHFRREPHLANAILSHPS